MKNLMKLLGLTILMVVIVGCETPTSYHEHIYDETNWTFDGTHHWHKAICGCNEVRGKAEHTWETVAESTETVKGTKKCTVCSREEELPLKDHTHTYSENWSSNDTDHWHDKTCTCTETTVKDKSTHTWDSGEITTPPTETSEGVKTYTCTVCSKTRTETIARLDHTHTYTSVVVAPTCTTNGYTKHTCSSCGDTYNDTTVAKLEHDFDETQTCTDHTVTCRRNGCSGTKQIVGLGHDFSNNAQTCRRNGCNAENPNYVAPLPSVSVKKQSNKMIVYIDSDTTGVICCEDDERFNKYFKATTKSTNVTYYVTLIDNLVVVVESSKVDDNNFYTETYKFTTDQTTLTSNDILASSSYIKIYGVKIPPQNN